LLFLFVFSKKELPLNQQRISLSILSIKNLYQMETRLIKSKIKLITANISNDIQALVYCVKLSKQIEGTPSDVSTLFNFYKSTL